MINRTALYGILLLLYSSYRHSCLHIINGKRPRPATGLESLVEDDIVVMRKTYQEDWALKHTYFAYSIFQ